MPSWRTAHRDSRTLQRDNIKGVQSVVGHSALTNDIDEIFGVHNVGINTETNAERMYKEYASDIRRKEAAVQGTTKARDDPVHGWKQAYQKDEGPARTGHRGSSAHGSVLPENAHYITAKTRVQIKAIAARKERISKLSGATTVAGAFGGVQPREGGVLEEEEEEEEINIPDDHVQYASIGGGFAAPKHRSPETYGHIPVGWLPACATRPSGKHAAPRPSGQADTGPLKMADIAAAHYLDALVCRNPFLQNGPPLGVVPDEEAVSYYGQDHRMRYPFLLPSARDEVLAEDHAIQQAIFELDPEFDCQPPMPWRAGVQQPPKLRYVVDTDGDGEISLEESQAHLRMRGVAYDKSTAFSYGFAPSGWGAGAFGHMGAAHYRYGEYDKNFYDRQ